MIRYRLRDLDDWLAAHLVEHTVSLCLAAVIVLQFSA
jgi:hypothetical protein